MKRATQTIMKKSALLPTGHCLAGNVPARERWVFLVGNVAARGQWVFLKRCGLNNLPDVSMLSGGIGTGTVGQGGL
ncbi:MAG: hypothetical protein LBH06_00410 [Rikenellaceae bacterium]|nr:hypothetical protein [Rikenellaceae bacterium]